MNIILVSNLEIASQAEKTKIHRNDVLCIHCVIKKMLPDWAVKNIDYLFMWDYCSEMTTLFFRAKLEQCVSLVLYFFIANVTCVVSYPLYPGFDV